MMDMSCQTGQGEGHTALNAPPPPTVTEGGGASLSDTQEILLNKSSSVSFCNPALYYQYVAAKCCN